MPVYTPPPPNAVEVILRGYTPPAPNAVSIELAGWVASQNTPQNLTLTWVTVPSRVRLAWTEGAPSQPGNGFRVYRSVNGGNWQLMDTLPLSTLQWDDTSVQYGNSYAYRVVEYYGTEESPPAQKKLHLRRADESQSGSDGRRRSVGRNRAESGSASDGRVRGLGRSRAESGGAGSDAWWKHPGPVRLESQAGSDGDYLDISAASSVLQVLADQPQRWLARGLAETGTCGEDAGYRWPWKLGLAEQGPGEEALWRELGRTVAENVSVLAATPRVLERAREETGGAADTRLVGLARAYWEDGGAAEDRLLRGLARGVSLVQGASWARRVDIVVPRGIEDAQADDGDFRDISIRRGYLESAAFATGARHVGLTRGEESSASDAWARLWVLTRALLEEAGAADAIARWVERTGYEAMLPPLWEVARGIVRPVPETAFAEDAILRALERWWEEVSQGLDGDFSALERLVSEIAAAPVEALGRWPGKVGQGLQGAEDGVWRAITRLRAEITQAAAGTSRSLRKVREELAPTEDYWKRALSYYLKVAEVAKLVAVASIPGGKGVYPWDSPPLKSKIIREVLKRGVRLEDI